MRQINNLLTFIVMMPIFPFNAILSMMILIWIYLTIPYDKIREIGTEEMANNVISLMRNIIGKHLTIAIVIISWILIFIYIKK